MDAKDRFFSVLMRTKYLKSTLEITRQIAMQAHDIFARYLNERLSTEYPQEESKQESPRPAQPNQDFADDTSESEHNHNQADSPIEQGYSYSEEDVQSKVESEEKEENIKKVFRKIVFEVHPDRLGGTSNFEKSAKKVLFEKARESFEKDDYYGIIEIAEQLNIDFPPPTSKQIEAMKLMNLEMEREIYTLKNSVVWQWHHADTDDVRKEIMDNYIEYTRENNLRT
tara:strand:- start:17774 stop:18451 length:678 start_codon:yes stop_codon:yes gene_type:complete